VAPGRRVHRLPAELPEQHQHHAVDPGRRVRGLIAHRLTACLIICIQLESKLRCLKKIFRGG
jgi:hypothetical protein